MNTILIFIGLNELYKSLLLTLNINVIYDKIKLRVEFNCGQNIERKKCILEKEKCTQSSQS